MKQLNQKYLYFFYVKLYIVTILGDVVSLFTSKHFCLNPRSESSWWDYDVTSDKYSNVLSLDVYLLVRITCKQCCLQSMLKTYNLKFMKLLTLLTP